MTVVKAMHFLKGLPYINYWCWWQHNQWPKWPKDPAPQNLNQLMTEVAISVAAATTPP